MERLLILLALFAIPAAASAQTVCLKHVDLMAVLSINKQQAVVGEGLSNGGAVVEVFVNDETGEWTVVAVLPNDVACILADGTDWNDTATPKGEPA